MLVLSRKAQQDIVVGENIRITVLQIKGNTVRIGIEAPREIRVIRGELPVKSESHDEVRQFTLNFEAQPSEHSDEEISTVPFPSRTNAMRQGGAPIDSTSSSNHPENRAVIQNRVLEILSKIRNSQSKSQDIFQAES